MLTQCRYDLMERELVRIMARDGQVQILGWFRLLPETLDDDGGADESKGDDVGVAAGGTGGGLQVVLVR